MLKVIEEDVASRLLKINAIKLSPTEPFTWASGIKSPIYCDNRISLTYPVTRDFIKNSLIIKSREFDEFDVVAGVATAGIAHGALLADALNKPFVYVRSKAKGHGRQNLIEGDINGDEKVLLVEDLISTGGSCIAAADALKDVGCSITGVLAIFTYGFDVARENFEKANIELKTLSNYDILIKEATDMGFISEENKSTLLEWSKDPKSWGK